MVKLRHEHISISPNMTFLSMTCLEPYVSSNINEAIKTTFNSFIQKLQNHKKA